MERGGEFRGRERGNKRGKEERGAREEVYM